MSLTETARLGVRGREDRGPKQAGRRPLCLQLSLDINLFLTEKPLCSQLRANSEGETGVEGTGMSCILKRNVKCDLQITDPTLPIRHANLPLRHRSLHFCGYCYREYRKPQSVRKVSTPRIISIRHLFLDTEKLRDDLRWMKLRRHTVTLISLSSGTFSNTLNWLKP